MGISISNQLLGSTGLSVGRGLSRGNGLSFGGFAGGPALYLPFALTGTLDPRITFSRPSLATMYDSTGRLVYAPNNAIFPSTPSATASWGTITGITLSPSQSDPFGGTTSVLMRETTDNSQHYVGGGGVTSWSGSTPFIYSIYIQQFGSGRFPQLQIQDQSSNAYQVTFDPPAGLSQITFSGGLYTNKFFGVQSLGSGWYRLYIGGSAPSGTTGFRILFLSASSYAGTNAFVGSTSNGFYLVGGQLEAVTYQTTPSTYNATTSAAYYGPRFDYNPATLVARGLLIEEARANICLRSEDFSTTWGLAAATITPNTLAAPDGTTTADTLTFATTGYDSVFQTITVANSTAHTFTFFAKAGTSSTIQVELRGAAGSSPDGTFNLSTGTATVDGGASGSPTVSMVSVGNGWYRCSVTKTSTSTSFIAIIGRNPAAVGQTVYLWGAQLEAGSFATSYIPTAASAVARSADSASMTGTNFSSWYNASEGSFIAVAASVRPTSSGGGVLAHTLNANNHISIDSNGNRVCFVTSGGVTVVDLSPGGVTSNVFAKFGQAYKVNDYAAVINAGTVLTDTSGALPSTPIQLLIGDNTSSEKLNGWIASLAYYNTRLPNATLQSLTLPVIADYYFLVTAGGDQLTDASDNPLYTQPLYL